jgi:hypothetical protein
VAAHRGADRADAAIVAIAIVLANYLSDNSLSLTRSLAGFHYLGRRHDELDIELRWAVRGPRFFAPDGSKP